MLISLGLIPPQYNTLQNLTDQKPFTVYLSELNRSVASERNNNFTSKSRHKPKPSTKSLILYRYIFSYNKYVIFICFIESQASVFTKEPPNPLLVVEGNRISLEWNYTLGSSLRDAEFLTTNTNPASKIVILDALDISNNVPPHIDPLYTGRVKANITASQAIITFLSVNRTDSGNYELHITRESPRQTFVGSVTITVQCK